MQLIIQIVALVSIYVCVGVFKYKTENSFTADLNDPVIRLHVGYFIVGMVGTIVSVLFSIWTYIDGAELLSLVFIVLSALFSLLIFAYFGFRIVFDHEKIMYRRFFEKPKVIYYKSINEIRFGLDIEIKTKSQKLVIPNYMTNTNALRLKILPFLPKNKKTKELPRVRRFRDAVERPWEFIVVFALLETVFGGVSVWICLASHVSISFYDPLFLSLVIVMLAITGVVFLSVHSAKRAHSSVLWAKVAKLMFKDGYLKD